jgi:hypothetical protein
MPLRNFDKLDWKLRGPMSWDTKPSVTRNTGRCQLLQSAPNIATHNVARASADPLAVELYKAGTCASPALRG